MTLLIATPVRAADPLTGLVSAGYCEAKGVAMATIKGSAAMPMSVCYATEIVKARNRIAAAVLRNYETVTHVLWWDDDEWPENVGLIQKMLDTGEDVIGAPYTNKRSPAHYVHEHLPGGPVVSGNMCEVKNNGFGFMLTSRRALQQMTDALVSGRWPELRVYQDRPQPHATADIFAHTYEETPHGWIKLGEDLAFCKRWRELGGRVMLYAGPGNIMAHSGARQWTARDIEGGVS